MASPLVVAFFVRDLWRLHQQSRKTRRALFIYSQVAWAEVWQRPQEFAMRAAFDSTVVYCCPVQVHTWLFNLRGRWKSIEQIDGGRVLVLSPLVLSGHFKNVTVFAVNMWIVGLLVRAVTRDTCEIFAVLNTPLGQPILNELKRDAGIGGKFRRVSYDIIDDFPAFSWAPRFSRKLENQLLQDADAVITGTYELKEMHSAARADIEFIPSGVDFTLFNTPVSPPAAFSRLPRPVIGYFGTISERIDLELIARLATAFPAASIVMIGPVHLRPESLPQAKNIHYLGLKAHKALPVYAQQFAVGLIPFMVSDATIKLNPTKTLEYLAAGVPVVSTAIPDVQRFFADAVLIGHSHDEFIAHTKVSLEEKNEQRIAAGIEMAKRASWDAMAARMLKVFTSDGGNA